MLRKLYKIMRKKFIPMSQYPDYLRKSGMKIGENCEIFKSANFGSEPYLVTLGNHVRINDGVKLITHDGGYWVLRSEYAGYGKEFCKADYINSIVVGNNVHIGTNAIIMSGVVSGDNSVIACGAVVTHNVPANSVVGGVPAKVIESLSEYADKARKKAIPTFGMDAEKKKKYICSIMDN